MKPKAKGQNPRKPKATEATDRSHGVEQKNSKNSPLTDTAIARSSVPPLPSRAHALSHFDVSLCVTPIVNASET